MALMSTQCGRMQGHFSRWLVVAVLGLLAAVGVSRAFEAFPFTFGGETMYLKWGDNHAGTPGD